MARYKVSYTIYKGPTGKTLKGPTFVHWLGDLCSGLGVMGILYVILSLMESYGTVHIIVGIVVAVAGFAIGAVLHKQAKKGAEAKFLKELAKQEGQTMTQSKD